MGIENIENVEVGSTEDVEVKITPRKREEAKKQLQAVIERYGEDSPMGMVAKQMLEGDDGNND